MLSPLRFERAPPAARANGVSLPLERTRVVRGEAINEFGVRVRPETSRFVGSSILGVETVVLLRVLGTEAYFRCHGGLRVFGSTSN